MALSVGHPRGTQSRYEIGCCVIPLGVCVLKITRDELPMEWGVYGGCLLCPLYPLLVILKIDREHTEHRGRRLHWPDFLANEVK